MDDKLVKAVINQLGYTDLEDEELRGTLEDISNYGINGGYGGFTYYSETVKFWRDNKPLIMEALNELADDLGEGVISMVRGFVCIKDQFTTDEVGRALYGRYDESLDLIYNALAWFAGEEVARFVTDL